MLTSADVISEVTKKLNRGGLMTNPRGPPFLLLPHRRDSLIQDAHPMIHQIGSNPSFEIRVKKRSQEFFNELVIVDDVKALDKLPVKRQV